MKDQVLLKLDTTAVESNLKALDARFANFPVDGRILIGVALIAVLASWVGAERAVSRRLKALN